MVIDTSALVAIVQAEPEADVFSTCIDQSPLRLVSAVNWVELSLVVRRRLGDEAEARVLSELKHIGVEIVAVDLEQAELARQAFAVFGKGRHPAALNFGDCFAYALAKARDLPLLFKGNDFSKTDVFGAVAV